MIVVNKSDVAIDPAAELAEVEPVSMSVPVYAVSAVTGEGLEALDPHLGHGCTIALLGSSGVGKSTLVNRLAGQELLVTAETSADGRKIAHQDVAPRSRPLPSGALLIDTPGMRELQLWADEEVLDTTFGEITELAAGCQFTDCSYRAMSQVQRCGGGSLADGSLSEERYTSYRKLQRELRALEVRKDARLRSDARKERARFARSQRKARW